MAYNLSFAKYQGTGNDFILIDGRQNDFSYLDQKKIAKLCDRRFGIGADGLIILKNRQGFDFDMDFYNSDGFPGSMCGNGGRCITAFAHDLKIIENSARFWAPDGVHEANYYNSAKIALLMADVETIETHEKGLFTNTGSPHLVIFEPINNLDEVYRIGKEIRYSNTYAPKGTNVNFVDVKEDFIELATYERGVENVTLSCGTGTVASVLATNFKNNMPSPVRAITPGGELSVQFIRIADGIYHQIYLIGPALKVFEGTIDV